MIKTAELNETQNAPRGIRALSSRDKRNIGIQAIVAAIVVFSVYYCLSNMFANIESRGISAGFDFLDEVAGFGISQHLIEYSDKTSVFWDVYIVGILNTAMVSVVCIVMASLLGLIVGICRLSRNFLVSRLSLVYIETFRNIPLLLQVLFWYNVVLSALPNPRSSIGYFDAIFLNNRGLLLPAPVFESGSIFVLIAFVLACIGVFFLRRWAKKRHELTGEGFPLFSVSIAILILAPLLTYFISGQPISADNPVLSGFNFKGGMTIIPEFLALAFAISIYTATYIAEAVRSGIESIPKGQTEAAASLGLRSSIAMRLIILPQALRVIIPPVINQYLNVVKNSSLATAIGYPELVTLFSGATLNQVGQAIEIILMTMAVYLTFSLAISMLLNWVNKKMEIKGR